MACCCPCAWLIMESVERTSVHVAVPGGSQTRFSFSAPVPLLSHQTARAEAPSIRLCLLTKNHTLQSCCKRSCSTWTLNQARSDLLFLFSLHFFFLCIWRIFVSITWPYGLILQEQETGTPYNHNNNNYIALPLWTVWLTELHLGLSQKHGLSLDMLQLIHLGHILWSFYVGKWCINSGTSFHINQIIRFKKHKVWWTNIRQLPPIIKMPIMKVCLSASHHAVFIFASRLLHRF